MGTDDVIICTHVFSAGTNDRSRGELLKIKDTIGWVIGTYAVGH